MILYFRKPSLSPPWKAVKSLRGRTWTDTPAVVSDTTRSLCDCTQYWILFLANNSKCKESASIKWAGSSWVSRPNAGTCSKYNCLQESLLFGSGMQWLILQEDTGPVNVKQWTPSKLGTKVAQQYVGDRARRASGQWNVKHLASPDQQPNIEWMSMKTRDSGLQRTRALFQLQQHSSCSEVFLSFLMLKFLFT